MTTDSSSSPSPNKSEPDVYLNGRDLGKQVGTEPSVLYRALLADGITLLRLGPRSWRILRSEWHRWVKMRNECLREEAKKKELKKDLVLQTLENTRTREHRTYPTWLSDPCSSLPVKP